MQLQILVGNHPEEMCAHRHARSSRLSDQRHLNRSSRIRDTLWMANRLPIQDRDLHLNDEEKEHAGSCISLWKRTYQGGYEQHKSTSLLACRCMATSGHAAQHCVSVGCPVLIKAASRISLFQQHCQSPAFLYIQLPFPT